MQQIDQTREKKLHESEQRFYQVFDQVPFVVQIYASDGTLRQTNQAWETIWGDSRDVLEGYNLLQDPQMSATGHLAYLKQAFAGEVVTLPPLFYKRVTNSHRGSSRWLEGFAYPLKNDLGQVQEVVLVTKDITQHKQTEEALQLRAEQLADVILAQQQIAMSNPNIDEVMALIVERIQQLTHANGAVIEIVEGDELVYHAVSGIATPYLGLRLKITTSLSGQCVQTGKILYSSDTQTDPRVDIDACRRIGIGSMIIVPLSHQGKTIGVLKTVATVDHAFTEQNIQMLELMAGFLSNTIHLASEFQAKENLLTALLASEERYSSMIAAMAEGITLQDADGRICMCNVSAQQILGLSTEQIMGRTSLDPRWHTIHEDGSPFHGQQHPPMVTLQTGEPCRNIIMGVSKPNGQLSWISINTQPLFHPDKPLPYAVVSTFSDITERKQAQEQVLLLQTLALQQSEMRYRAIVEDQTELIARYLPDGTITFANQAYILYFQQSLETVIGRRYQPMIFEADRERVVSLVASMSANNPVVTIENRVIVGQEIRWTQWHYRMLFDDQGCFMEYQSVGRDITAFKQIEETLFHEKELAQVTLQSIGDAVITTDAAGRIEYLNPVAESLTGWNQSAVQGVPLVEVLTIVDETTREPVDNPIEQALQENRVVSLANHTILITRNQHEIAIEDSAAPIRDREGQIIGAVMVFRDVTHNRTLSRQLSWQASHDPLTGLVNRREFERQVEQALSQAKLDYQVHALCYLDIDRFKIVNDTCGHVAGDELLRQLSALLQSKIRKTDTLARLGGDEFGVLLKQCTLKQALQVAEKLRECVHQFRFVWQDLVFTVGISIGLIGIDADSKSFAEIIRSADAACYSAKTRGRNRVYTIQTNDHELLQQRGEMQWVSRIGQALESDLFCLFAQPIAAIPPTADNGDHYEVLLRLSDQQGNLVPPMAFIPAAERYSLMHLIDRWVIRKLFSDLSNLVNTQQSIYAINLSGSSINDDQFIDFLYEQFALYPVCPQHICFEITETVAISNLTKASQFIQELQCLGCRFALDDFGAGMSSFAYLKSLPVDYLKIDGSFIRNIVENPVDSAIVAAIAHIGSVMGIQTIAEFVENDAILERITALGINYAQGYGIAAPCPLIT